MEHIASLSTPLLKELNSKPKVNQNLINYEKDNLYPPPSVRKCHEHHCLHGTRN